MNKKNEIKFVCKYCGGESFGSDHIIKRGGTIIKECRSCGREVCFEPKKEG